MKTFEKWTNAAAMQIPWYEWQAVVAMLRAELVRIHETVMDHVAGTEPEFCQGCEVVRATGSLHEMTIEQKQAIENLNINKDERGI